MFGGQINIDMQQFQQAQYMSNECSTHKECVDCSFKDGEWHDGMMCETAKMKGGTNE